MTQKQNISAAEQAKIFKSNYKDFIKQKKFIAHIPNPQELCIWHITMKGPKQTPFEGGYYHFMLNLKDYPAGPPEVHALNENGSFQINTRMCIETVSNYTPSAWQGISIMTLVENLQFAFTDPTPQLRQGVGYINDISSPAQQQKIRQYAQNSGNWVCPKCKKMLKEYEIEQD